MTAAINVGGNWSDQGTSLRLDILSLVLALALHAPLYFMKFAPPKRGVEQSKSRLVSIDLIDPELQKRLAEAPPPLRRAKEASLMEKLKALVKNEPPPPPPVKKEVIPEKLADAPKELSLQAKLDLPEKTAPKLATKSGFKTNADPKLIEEKKLEMKGGVPGIAPLSAEKLGTVADRESLKSNKGKFQISSGENISSIGGDSGPSLSGGAAPTIALKTGDKGSTEKFSAPPPQKTNKGRIGGVPSAGLDSGPSLGLRDAIIARDAAPTQIANAGGTREGVVGGIPGGTGTKRDAGRFQESGIPGGVGGGTGRGLGSTVVAAPKINPVPVQKKKQRSMFTITGPLKDRKIVRQVIPEYPSWAQAQGIEASVVLEFTVEPGGSVKNNIVVRRTSGYPRLDETTMKALRQWKFVSLSEDQNREEVGLITFNYALN